MEKSTRKNFRCKFGLYVTPENRESVIQSILAQFNGYFADPEITSLDDNEFLLSINIGDGLSPTLVRDKILWNYFVESVTAQEAMNRVQIIRVPKSSFSQEVPKGSGTLRGLGPQMDRRTGDTGVDEKLYVDQNYPPSYAIGVLPQQELGNVAGRRFNSRNANRSDEALPDNLTGEGISLDDESQSPETLTTLDDKPAKVPAKLFSGNSIVSGSVHYAIDSDSNANFTPNSTNGFTSVEKAPAATGIGGGAPISGASMFVYDPENAQGTEVGSERIRGDAESAPLSFAAGKALLEEEEELPGPYGATLDVLGVEGAPMGGTKNGSFFFGLNDNYTYESEIYDDYDF